MTTKPLIRFDWAMKRLLCQKSNFVILEGFLSELIKEDIIIEQIKVITEYLGLGERDSRIKKVYSINIVYSDLGQGTDKQIAIVPQVFPLPQ